MKAYIERQLNNIWYGNSICSKFLLPFSGVFYIISILRKYFKQKYQKKITSVPVIVVGNITVGGTGKTPLVCWLANFLKSEGFKPGIISRGFGGKLTKGSVIVDGHSSEDVGDEPILIKNATQSPVAIGLNRNNSIKLLLKKFPKVNVIISDDGLQHYSLARNVEIAVLDSTRGVGNGYLLPAGPLREGLKRLQGIDFIIANGNANDAMLVRLKDTIIKVDYSLKKPISELIGKTVHAVAGIGNPTRFFTSLEKAGINVICHAFADHHYFSADDLNFNDDLPIVMTEKDAVKCKKINNDKCWFVGIDVELPKSFGENIINKIRA